MVGLSSKGWNDSSTAMSSPIAASAFSSACRPIAHQGQATSETNSIFMGLPLAG
jgi:hypothetical protein